MKSNRQVLFNSIQSLWYQAKGKRGLSSFFLLSMLFFLISCVEMRTAVVFNAVTVNGLNSAVANGSVRALPSVPGWGGELGLYYHLPKEKYRLGLEGLLFAAHRDFSACRNPLFSTWDNEQLIPLKTIDTHYRLHLGYAALCLDQLIQISSSLRARPSLACLFTSVRQKFFVHEDQLNENQVILRHMKNKYWGLGPQGAGELEWFFLSCIALKMKGSLALLYGPFYIHQDKRLAVGQVKQMRLFDQFFQGVAIGKISLSICGYLLSSQRLALELGMDQTIISAQDQFLRQPSSKVPGLLICNQGDLSLIGAHFSLLYQF